VVTTALAKASRAASGEGVGDGSDGAQADGGRRRAAEHDSGRYGGVVMPGHRHDRPPVATALP
jgi:hypothetical protein